MNIGERLVQERKRLGLSQTAFAKQIGVSLSSQKRYELGEREPNIGYLERAMRLGMDISYILTDIRREQDHLKELGVDEFHGARIFDAIAKLLKFTKDDLSAVIQSVDTAMEHDLYRNLPPDDSVFASEEFFLIAASELLNKKLQTKEFENTNDKVDFKILHEIIENLELIQQNNNLILTPYKKARAVVMLYRSFKASGKIDPNMIEDIVAISGESLDNSKNTF